MSKKRSQCLRKTFTKNKPFILLIVTGCHLNIFHVATAFSCRLYYIKVVKKATFNITKGKKAYDEDKEL